VNLQTLFNPLLFHFIQQIGVQVSSVAEDFVAVAERGISVKASELISIQVGSLG
jgi:hypothetical protein